MTRISPQEKDGKRKIQRWILSIAGAILLTGLGAYLWSTAVHGSHLSWSPSDDISYAEFITIILTALGVMLTALTLFIAALAIFGFAWFETNVKLRSEDFLEKRFSAEDPRYVELVEDLKEDVRREVLLLNKNRKTSDIENESPFDEDAA